MSQPEKPPARSYVTLGIDSEVFAVPVESVREILDYRRLTRLPEAPAFLAGMIDVRGCAVPVIDLRARLGFTPTEVTPHTRLLVMEADCGGRLLQLGLLADRVFEVAEIAAEAVESAPEIGIRWKSEYILGVSRLRGAFVIIFDLGRLFGADEAARLESAA